MFVDRFAHSTSPKQAIRFVRRMRGHSQAVLVQCDDWKYYILKMAGNPQGPNVLANEWLGSVLAAAVGLPVAKPQFINVSPTFLSNHPELTLETSSGAHQPVAGLHLGTMLVGEVEGASRSIQYLVTNAMDRVANRGFFLGMYLFDLWAMQREPRKAIFRASAETSAMEAVFVDHGHLFGGPNWNLPKQKLFASHHRELYAGLWSDSTVTSWIEVFQGRIPEVLPLAFAMVPDHWYAGDLSAVEASLLSRLHDLAELINGIRQFERLHR